MKRKDLASRFGFHTTPFTREIRVEDLLRLPDFDAALPLCGHIEVHGHGFLQLIDETMLFLGLKPAQIGILFVTQPDHVIDKELLGRSDLVLIQRKIRSPLAGVQYTRALCLWIDRHITVEQKDRRAGGSGIDLV